MAVEGKARVFFGEVEKFRSGEGRMEMMFIQYSCIKFSKKL